MVELCRLPPQSMSRLGQLLYDIRSGAAGLRARRFTTQRHIIRQAVRSVVETVVTCHRPRREQIEPPGSRGCLVVRVTVVRVRTFHRSLLPLCPAAGYCVA
jgi:hypothetical protein